MTPCRSIDGRRGIVDVTMVTSWFIGVWLTPTASDVP